MDGRLIIDDDVFDSHWPHTPFTVEHCLADNPLFEFPRLMEMLGGLPKEKIEFYSGKVPVSGDPRRADPTGLTAEETLNKIANCESWLVLKNIELNDAYREFVHDLLDEIRPAAEAIDPNMYRREGWIFVTSPGSVTPYHMDPEHNFLLQIRGSKTVHMFDGKDRDVVSEIDLENKHTDTTSKHRNQEFPPELQEKANSFTITPGTGLYLPFCDPHWVQNGDEVSISLSISFYSDCVDRMARFYRFNAKLRSMGLDPTPHGISPLKDKAKDVVWRSMSRLKEMAGLG